MEGNKAVLDNPSAVVSKWQMQKTSKVAKKLFEFAKELFLLLQL